MRQSHLILSNALIMWASRVLLLFPQLILVPFLISNIGEKGYGIYAMVWSLLYSIDRLEKSLQSGVIKYSAGYFAQGAIDQVSRIASTAWVFTICFGVLASVSVSSFALVYGASFDGLTTPLLTIGILMLFIMPITPFIGLIQSRQRYYVSVIAETVSKYISLALIYTFFNIFTPSVSLVVFITSGMLLLSRMVQVPIAYRMIPGLKVSFFLTDKSSMRQLLAFGGVTVFIAISLILNNAGLRWLMGALESPAFVTRLTIMLMPGLLLSQVVSGMTITIMPATSAYESTGDYGKLREILRRGSFYTMVVVLTAFCFAFYAFEMVITLWVGEEYIYLVPYMIALLGGYCFILAGSVAHHLLKGLEMLRAAASIAFLERVIIPGFLLIAIYTLTYNPYYALSLSLPVGFVCGTFLNLYVASRKLSIDGLTVIRRACIQPFCAAGASILLTMPLHYFTKSQHLIWQLAIGLMASCLFLLLIYTFCATSREHEQFLALARSFVFRIRAVSGMAPRSKRST